MQKKNRFNFVTLGCSKNLYDTEKMMGELSHKGQEVSHEASAQEDDIVVINTCGFVEDAKQESIDTILQYLELKKQNKISKLVVTGCLSERYGKEIQAELKGIDEIYGTRDFEKFVKELSNDYKTELVGERKLTTPSHFAYLKISEGCDRPCSFCAIPLMRGKHRSKTIEELLVEAKTLAAQGVKELILIAQDLTYYGLDIYKQRKIAELTAQLSQVEGIEWIRLHYAYPAGFPIDLIKEIKDQPKVCKYLDMPLQHINDDILASMRRGLNKKKTNTLIENIRKEIPDICLRTTLIVGYPGESEAIFQELYDWVEEVKFDRLGCFPYSHEEDTFAYRLEDNIPLEVKQERIETLMGTQEDISLRKNMNLIGKTLKVLIDGEESNKFIGRTEFDSPEVDNEVLVKKPKNEVKIGEFYNVLIEEAEAFDLTGTIV